MPNFDPELIGIMRTALDEVMTKVPLEYSTQATKAYVAECILRAAAEGHRTCDELVGIVTDQIPLIVSLFT
jgi:hypothetical protein